MQVINKKIIVIFICLSIFIFGLFKLFDKKEIELDNVILDINNSKDSLAIYIEEYDEEGNASYVESDNNEFPLDNYVYNKTLSGCLDNNSNEVEGALKYDYVSKELNLRVNKPVTCYVYYDYKGDGTEKVPYKIRSIEDLLDLSLSTKGGNIHSNEYFELTRDLDFRDKNSYNDSERTDYGNLNGITDDNNALINEMTTGTGWVPIGESETKSFQGIFDGNNKNLKNIYINSEVIRDMGLFGFISNSIIKNLNLYGEMNTKVNSDIGGLAGKATNTTIENVNNYANVTSMVGGYTLGGILGTALGENVIIKNCANYGNITNSNNAGGLVGLNSGILTIENSHNEGTITNSLGHHAGGLIGRDDKATNKLTILNSYNNGKVIIDGTDRSTYSGGLVGLLYGNAYINNSYNKGEINTNIDASLTGVFSGGLIGVTLGKTIITNSHNGGNITGGNRVGGLIGQLNSEANIVVIDKCYNLGNLLPSKNSNWQSGVHVGGITSQVWKGAKLYIFNSYNTGNMEANLLDNGYAGFISIINGDTINNQIVNIVNSYNTGNISGSNIGVGFSRLINGTLKLNNVYSNIEFDNVTTKYGIGEFKGPGYTINKAYYKNNDNISGSNITNEEIIGKDLSYMQSNEFVTELNKNIESITLTDYIDNTLLTEFKTTTGYDLTLSKWTLKDNIPTLIY